MAKKQASESKDKFKDAVDKLNKQYGIGTVLALDSKSHVEYDVISTGSIGFDYITLGVGGVVQGTMYSSLYFNLGRDGLYSILTFGLI